MRRREVELRKILQRDSPRIERLANLVSDGREGVLYDTSNPDALATALERLASAAVRQPMGAAARARAVAEFSWASHCRHLSDAIQEACTRPRCAS